MPRPTDIGALAPVLLLAALPALAGEVRLEAGAPALPLCAGASAEVRVVSVALPRLSASAGALSPPRPDGPGRWVADYRPPEECWPQVAIVAAEAGGAWASLTLPLVGQGEALVKTWPRAVITVRIGAREFGPAQADASGRALVPVEVPPGVRSAWHGKREIPLGLPPMRRVHVALGRDALAADQAGELVVRAFAVDEEGGPGDAAALTLSAAEGQLGLPRVVAPGVAEARWRLAPGRAEPAVVVAFLPGDRGGEARAVLQRPAGPPESAVLTAVPAVLVAGGGGEVRVVVRLRDAQGNPASGPTRLTASFGEVTSFAPAGPGEWSGLVSVPEALGGRRRLELAVEAGGAAGRTLVRLRPGPPERLALETPETTLVADGRGEALVRLTAADRFGNLADEPPSLAAELGRVGAPVPDGAGGWRATYRPPRLERSSWDSLSARLGVARGGERLRLLARSRTLTLSPRLGLALRRGGVSPAASLEVALWPEAFRGRLGLAAEAGWWAFSRTDLADAGGQPLRLSGRADMAPLLLTALGRLRLGERGQAWLGAGGGAVFLWARQTQGGLGAIGEAGVAPEAHAQAGAGWRLGPGSPFLEARAAWQGASGVSSLSGSLVTLTLSLGYRLDAR